MGAGKKLPFEKRLPGSYAQRHLDERTGLSSFLGITVRFAYLVERGWHITSRAARDITGVAQPALSNLDFLHGR